MDIIVELLKAANSLTPLAIIGLLVAVLLFQAKNREKNAESFETLSNNHLHELPTILETLQRIETANATAFATIIAKLNGHAK